MGNKTECTRSASFQSSSSFPNSCSIIERRNFLFFAFFEAARRIKRICMRKSLLLLVCAFLVAYSRISFDYFSNHFVHESISYNSTAYLGFSVFFATSRITGIEPPLLLAGGWRMSYFDPATCVELIGLEPFPLSLIIR